VSEFDELVSMDGVLMAGRFGPDWHVAEYKRKALYIEDPSAVELTQWFCAAIAMMFNSMAFAVDSIGRTGFDQTSWLPVKGWTYSGGDYAIAVRGDRFVIAELAKLGSLDELNRLANKGQQPGSIRE
jgi:roadblock/LC7 domain-containing protein